MHTTVVSSPVIRFGVFEANLSSGELRKNGARVKIQELPFRALKLLLSRPNEVLNREEFRKALWPDGVFVDFDHGISSAINRLRDALGDSAENPLFIETVERRGYRWIAPTHSPEMPLQEAAQPDIQDVATIPSVASPRKRWIWILPVLALLLLVWIFRASYRGSNAVAATSPSFSLSSGASHHPANPEAVDLYLKGRFYWNKRTPEDLNKALDYFTQAIVHDPSYAPAYVGLADCYNLMREYTLMPSTEAYPRALAAAKTAVALDDHSSEAHASVAFVSFWGMWDAATADKEFRRAIELSPNNAIAHHWYATYLSEVHRYPEALQEIDRAQALDPNSPSILADKGLILWMTGRHDEALRLLRQMEAAEPDFVSPHRYLKSAYREEGEYSGYLSEMRKEALLLHDSSELAEADAAQKGLAAGGPKNMLESMLQVQKKFYGKGLASPFDLAETCALLGDKDQAFQYLQASFNTHNENLLSLSNDAAFNSLHDAPAYRDLIASMSKPARN